jgi:hypothetical protein
MDLTEIVIFVVLITWFLLTAVHNCDARILRSVKRHDVFNLIPRWRFFAPSPLQADFDLFYRDRFKDEITPFQRIPVHSNGSLFKFLFNPYGRIKKSVYHTVSRLTKRSRGDASREDIILSLDYLALVSLVCKLPAAPGAQRQFVIVVSYGPYSGREPTLFMTSEFHDVA